VVVEKNLPVGFASTHEQRQAGRTQGHARKPQLGAQQREAQRPGEGVGEAFTLGAWMDGAMRRKEANPTAGPADRPPRAPERTGARSTPSTTRAKLPSWAIYRRHRRMAAHFNTCSRQLLTTNAPSTCQSSAARCLHQRPCRGGGHGRVVEASDICILTFIS